MSRFSVYGAAAAAFGFLSVAVGAFGAHGVSDPRAKALLDLGARYQAIHALAAIGALAFWRWGGKTARHAPPFFIVGISLFSGSLYALAFGAPPIAGAITPLGGISFMIGWGLLACGALKLKNP